jgi:hypothetical protein
MTGFHLTDSPQGLQRLYDRAAGKLRVGVNPAFSKVNNEPFCLFSGFESIGQRVNRVRLSLAIDLPSDFCARAPELAALLKSGVRNDEAIVIEQICHADELWPPGEKSYAIRVQRKVQSSPLEFYGTAYVRFAVISSSLAAKSIGLPNGWGQSIPVGQ